MMLFIFCEACGIPLRPPASHCVRCRPEREQRRRTKVKKKTVRRDQSS